MVGITPISVYLVSGIKICGFIFFVDPLSLSQPKKTIGKIKESKEVKLYLIQKQLDLRLTDTAWRCGGI
jgi:hypothetical protein